MFGLVYNVTVALLQAIPSGNSFIVLFPVIPTTAIRRVYVR